jgi:hypothetical protein
MVNNSLTNYSIPSLKWTDTVKKGISLCKEHSLKFLPVVHEGQFSGYFDVENSAENFSGSTPIHSVDLEFGSISFLQNTNIWEFATTVLATPLDCYAVLALDGSYEGAFAKADLVKEIVTSLPLTEKGLNLELSTNTNNYSMSNLARIIEAEGCKILFIGVKPSAKSQDYTSTHILVKLEQLQNNNLGANLERMGYKIISSSQPKETFRFEQERLDNLLKYLEF